MSVIKEKHIQIKAFAYAFHDKDDNEPHTHILIYLYSARKISCINNWFKGFVDDNGKNINTLVQDTLSPKGAVAYLTHENEIDKVHYDLDIVKGENIGFFMSEEVFEDSLVFALEDMINGVPLITLVRRYGRDFIIHYKNLKQITEDISYD